MDENVNYEGQPMGGTSINLLSFIAIAVLLGLILRSVRQTLHAVWDSSCGGKLIILAVVLAVVILGTRH
jgi:hypothetical protein